MPLDEADAPALLRLAEWLADPARWYRGDAGIDPDLRGVMAASPVLRPVLNHWLAEAAGIARHAVGPDDLTDALAVGLLVAEDAVLDRAARLFGAAVMAERLRGAVLKAERQRLADLLGPEAVEFGLRRAPVFARSLAELPLAGGDDPLGAGMALCGGLVAQGGAGLAGLFRLRLGPAVAPVALSARQVHEARGVLAMQGALP